MTARGSRPDEQRGTRRWSGRVPPVCLLLLAVIGCRPEEGTWANGSGRTQEVPAAPGDAGAGGLSGRERRGREIYLRGSSPGGRPIRAFLGQSREPIDAALLACGNCHGQDGRGRPEGGVVPPDVTWRSLCKPYGSTDRFVRRRPAYTEPRLRMAVTMGRDAGGRTLDAAMPRYLMAPEELDDLIAYLAVLGGDLDPGLSPTSITVGTLLPPERLDPGGRQAVLAALNAITDEANRGGGLFNRRRLSVVVGDLDPTREPAGESVARFLDDHPVFALLAADIRGVEEEVVRVVEARGVPLIGPHSTRPHPASPPLRNIFYLYPGLADQARALATTAARSPSAGAPAILHDDDPVSAQAALAVADTWTRLGRRDSVRISVSERDAVTDPDRLVARLAGSQTGVVAYLGRPTFFRPLIEAANRASWRPAVYLPAALAGRDLFDLPPSFGGTIVLGLPYLPDDMTPAGRAEYETLRSAGGLPTHHQPTQMASLAAAKVFLEGVRRCGRELSRVRLVEALERLGEFPTGFSRPLTFGPNRRNGSTGAYVLTLDLAGRSLRPDGGWVEAKGTP